MSDLGKQGGSKAQPDDPANVGKNPGQPTVPDHKVTSVVAPPALPSFGSNDANKAK